MALFTGAFFVAQVSLIIVAKPFYAIFCTSCVPHKPKTGFTACQIVDNLERLGTLWYAMKQIWRTKKIIKMASNIEIQKKCEWCGKGDERRLFVALEYNAEVIFVLFAFCNRACHIVVQPHNNLAEADLASRMIVPVIEIAFDVVGTPFHKLFLKVSGPRLQFLIGSRNLYLLGKNNHF